MTVTKPAMKMSELPVFVRSLATGFIGAEIWRSAFYVGTSFARTVPDVALWAKAGVILAVAVLCITYLLMRSAHVIALRIARSFRFDLLVTVGIGIWANYLTSPWLAEAHAALNSSDPHWAPAVMLLFCAVLASPLVQQLFLRSKKAAPQLYFIADEEIGDEKDDLFASETQAKSFAEAVLESGAHQGLVFGVDGPWGVGKTSFINLAARYWDRANDRVIICRFEPLRYASEPDLADRMIREVCAAIQRKVFAPEFRPAASRYSRLIKGKADVSFLGFKLSLEPSQETADDLLEDIDQTLRRIDCRVIIVIDDLDRLDAKTTNNVLFATRRTFKLSQATYVLCYDTEILAGTKKEDSRAREFLEKFVTVKLSLFVDSSKIRDFLRRDWQREENQLGSIPSDTMLKLSAVLNELANILDGNLAAKYLPLVGDMRKVKRFVNAMLLMQLEKSDLGRTDFNKRDLINLILLHLNFPGLFRRIYAEETEGRSGTFSVYREYGEQKFKNATGFSQLAGEHKGVDGFLLNELFDVNTLGFAGGGAADAALASRACFNHDSFRNLESYLKLIVRFATPEPRETFVLYQEAVERVRKGALIASVLEAHDFRLEFGEQAHDQFWSALVNQSSNLTRAVAEDAINTLVDYLPRYSVVESRNRGLRQRSIYSLLRLLDRAGWGRTSGRRRPNTPEDVIEIAWRIFGEGTHEGKGLLERLVGESRGTVGWNDLMLFRLQCSADRQGQLHNLHSALILNQDESAPTNGLINGLALMGMRKISQEVFKLFRLSFIDLKRNFLSEVEALLDAKLMGEAWLHSDLKNAGPSEQGIAPASQQSSAARSSIKSFVIYQLTNALPPSGSGVGCGYYDESGTADGGGIAKLMNQYMFDVCFNPTIDEENIFHFLDHCLSHLSSPFLSGIDSDGYSATRTDLPGGLNQMDVGRYWIQHRDLIRQRVVYSQDRHVVTINYVASYRDDLPGVFEVLDELANGENVVGIGPE